jgi:hypothetical protein
MPPPETFTEEGCFITELHNTELDPAVSIARARVEPGVLTALLRHNGQRPGPRSAAGGRAFGVGGPAGAVGADEHELDPGALSPR